MDDNKLPQGMLPGKDADEHTQNLQSDVAGALGVPKEEVTPVLHENEEPRPMGLDLENMQEDFNAAVPWNTPTSRFARSKEFLIQMVSRFRKKNPGKEVKVEETK